MFVRLFRPFIILNIVLLFSFSISVNTFVRFEIINLVFYIFFHIVFIYTLIFYYNISIFITGLFYGIFFDIILLKEISSHLLTFIILILLYIATKKYLFLLSSYQVSTTIFITLIITLLFELILTYIIIDINFTFIQIVKYIIISLLIFVPSIYLLNKLDK